MGDYTIGGIDGISISNQYHDIGIVAVKGWHAYVIMYSAPIDKYEVNLPAAEYIMRTVKFN